MRIRKPPPGRMSALSVVVVKPRGAPCQCCRCSAFVHASKTSSRGASKRRVITSSCALEDSLILALLAAMFLLFPYFFLHFAQIIVQTIETPGPEPPIVLHPIGNVPQRARREPAGPPLGIASPRNQSGSLQHLQVLGDSGQAHLERLSELCYRNLSRSQPREDRPPGGIGKRGAGAAEAIGCNEWRGHCI